MAWSRNPLTYPTIYQRLLEAAKERRTQIKFTTLPGRTSKYKFQFYGFIEAWKWKAMQSRKLQNFALAAEEEANASVLGRYLPVLMPDGIAFVNKDVVAMNDGVRMEVSESRVDDDALDQIEILAQVQGEKEQQLALTETKDKKTGIPMHKFDPIQARKFEEDGKRMVALFQKRGVIQDKTPIDLDEEFPCERCSRVVKLKEILRVDDRTECVYCHGKELPLAKPLDDLLPKSS